MSKISAVERLGLVFLFVILAQYDEGWQILHTTCAAYNAKAAHDDESTTKEVPPVDLLAVLSIFEAMICFDQWLNQTTYWTMEHHAKSKSGYAKGHSDTNVYVRKRHTFVNK